ncbi:5727_t:CDS:2 [Diversispora eburnea]|uniref:5727_t:CDS:1 n=1 Tax=Diversispora eburnea TaxID=1213867 RepID=A0A9N9AU79_9GLOM|nr:5727_t:CDS:2 [Diversispora eburnea]
MSRINNNIEVTDDFQAKGIAEQDNNRARIGSMYSRQYRSKPTRLGGRV